LGENGAINACIIVVVVAVVGAPSSPVVFVVAGARRLGENGAINAWKAATMDDMMIDDAFIIIVVLDCKGGCFRCCCCVCCCDAPIVLAGVPRVFTRNLCDSWRQIQYRNSSQSIMISSHWNR